jgi:hypothetical protein
MSAIIIKKEKHMDSKAVINFLTSSTTHRENFGLSNGYIQNMYLDENNLMRNFWGYKKLTDFPSRLTAFLIDITGNYYFGITAQNEFVIYSKTFTPLLTINIAAFILTNDIIKNFINATYCDIIQTPDGNLVLTNGGFCGLFLVKIPRDDNRNIVLSGVGLSQYPYAPSIDYNPTTKQFSRLKFPKYLEFFDDKVLVTDGALNLVYFSSNLFAPATTIWNSIAISSRADKIQKAVRIERTLCIVGENCVEFWYPSQDEFGFAKYNWLVESGTIFSNSITVINGKLVYLGSNDNSSPEVTIINLKEQGAKELNQNGLSIIFENLLESDQVFGLNFSPAGQSFYILHYSGDKSLLININTNDYFFLTDENKKTAKMDKILRNDNQWIFLANNGQIYQMSSDIYDYDGKQIPMIIKPSLTQSDLNFTLKKLIVLMRPHTIKINNINDDGYIQIYANTDSTASTEGIQSNYTMEKSYELTLDYKRTRYFDENVPSNVYNVCQMYAEISQIIAIIDDKKVFFPVIFAKFDVEVEFS